jgi:hypothetical protein
MGWTSHWPAGWQARSSGPRGPVEHLGSVPTWFIAIAVILAIVGLTSTADVWWPGSTAAGSHSTTASVQPVVVPPMYATAAPTAGSSLIPSAVAKVSPFAGSPVEKWADGLVGLVLPAAHRVGSYTSSQTADALAKSRDFVRAANLDDRVLYHGSFEPVDKTLDADSVAGLLSASRSLTPTNSPLWWVSRFDPRRVEPESAVVKVNGALHARAQGRFLAVHSTTPSSMPYGTRRRTPRGSCRSAAAAPCSSNRLRAISVV